MTVSESFNTLPPPTPSLVPYTTGHHPSLSNTIPTRISPYRAPAHGPMKKLMED